MGKKKEDWKLLPKSRGPRLLGKKPGKMLKTKGSKVVPWGLHNPSIFRGKHKTPIKAMEAAGSGKTRMKKKTQYLSP